MPQPPSRIELRPRSSLLGRERLWGSRGSPKRRPHRRGEATASVAKKAKQQEDAKAVPAVVLPSPPADAAPALPALRPELPSADEAIGARGRQEAQAWP